MISKKVVWRIARPILLVFLGFILARFLFHFFASVQLIPFLVVELHLILASCAVGLIVGEKGWLYGLTIALLNIAYFIIVVSKQASFGNIASTLFTTRLSTISFQIVSGITGGLLGGLVKMGIMYVSSRKQTFVRMFLYGAAVFGFFVVAPLIILQIRVEKLLMTPRILAFLDIVLVCLIIVASIISRIVKNRKWM